MPLLSKKARSTKRKGTRREQDWFTVLGLQQPPDKPHHRVYIRRNPRWHTKNDLPYAQKCIYDWILVENTMVHDTNAVYANNDLVLYTGPKVYSEGKIPRLCFIPDRIYRVAIAHWCRNDPKEQEQITLCPADLTNPSSNIPAVSLQHVRHVRKNIETKRIIQASEDALLRHLGKVIKTRTGFDTATYGFAMEKELSCAKALYVMQRYFAEPMVVQKALNTVGLQDAKRARILQDSAMLEMVFFELWDKDVLAVVEQ